MPTIAPAPITAMAMIHPIDEVADVGSTGVIVGDGLGVTVGDSVGEGSGVVDVGEPVGDGVGVGVVSVGDGVGVADVGAGVT
jgi:hypothetical protein